MRPAQQDKHWVKRWGLKGKAALKSVATKIKSLRRNSDEG